MSGKKNYFPNNWQQYKDAPDEMFLPHLFEEVMDWKVAGWELPASVACIIRVTEIPTSKVTEYVYQKKTAAANKIRELFRTPDIEFTVRDPQSIHHLSPPNND